MEVNSIHENGFEHFPPPPGRGTSCALFLWFYAASMYFSQGSRHLIADLSFSHVDPRLV